MIRFPLMALAIATSFVLTGCFFTQEAPKNNLISEEAVITGNVVVEDLTLSNQGGVTSAQAVFYKTTTKKTEPVSSFTQPLRFGSLAVADGERAPECQSAKGPNAETTRAGDPPISVGPVFF